MEWMSAMEQISMPAPTDPVSLHRANDQSLEFNFLFSAAKHETPSKTESSAFSLFGSSMQATSHAVMMSMSDSDDDFGEFKSVPPDESHANVLPVALSNSPDFSSRQGYQAYDDMFDLFSSKPNGLRIGKSVSEGFEDPLGSLTFSNGNSLVHSEKLEGVTDSAPPTLKPQECSSDDDWGEFVEHSTSAHKEPFDWFEHSSESVSSVNDGVSSALFEFPKVTGLEAVSTSQNARASTGFAGFETNGFSLFDRPDPIGKEGSIGVLGKRFDEQELKSLTNGVTASPSGLALQRMLSRHSMSYHSSHSAVEKISTPIPLSLFGEADVETEKSQVNLGGLVAKPFQGHSRSKSLSGSSQPSGTGNFVDLISSLYAESRENVSLQLPFNAVKTNVKATEENKVMENGNKDLPGHEFDLSGCANNIATSVQPNFIKTVNISLEEQLFDVNLSFEDLESYCKVPSMQFSDADKFVMESASSVDYKQLLQRLIKEGRYHEVLACREHFLTLHQLACLQERSALEVDTAESQALHKEMEGIKMKLAKLDAAYQWQIQNNSNNCKTDLNACKGHTFSDMLEKLGKPSSDRHSMVFEAEFQPDKLQLLVNSDMNSAVEFVSKAASTFLILACASVHDQQAFVRAWEALLSVCATELELALNVWEQAQRVDVHLTLVADPKGKSYYASVGQVYAASLILAAASNVYRPWLDVAAEEGKKVRATLVRCKAAWVGTGLKDAVNLALHGLESTLPASILSWRDIDSFPTTAQKAAVQAARFEHSQTVCGLSLLPLLSFDCIPSVEWSGCHYLLPLANLWSNRVSDGAPALPSLQPGSIMSV